ncbi:MAG: DEAD/DEAH box helicase [Thermoplasmata archaeon]|nr:DEAD/DEAH box helicase [Thermoplasmata archaeon]
MKMKEIIENDSIALKLEKDGITEATHVQEKAIPVIMEGNDVVVKSETGSGKTLAFVLPIIENIEGNGIEALVIAPTRELAKQITGVFNRYSKFRATAIYGGVSISNQINELKRTNIVVGTPGRLLDLIRRQELNLKNVKYLVLDEADRMLDMGFIDDIESIIKATKRERQTMLFSATIPEQVVKISKKYMKNAEKIMIEGRVTSEKQEHMFYVVSFNEKFSLLVHLLKKNNDGISLIFCATKRMTDNVAKELRKNGIKSGAIHGDMSQKQREEMLKRFRKREIDVLVATDVAARGLDIDNIGYIYNFDVPREEEMYVHRAGRTARMGNEGRIISLVSEKDYTLFGRIARKNDEIKEMKKPDFERVHFRMEKAPQRRWRR